MVFDLACLTSGSSPFDQIRRFDPDGTEWWSARDLMQPLGYTQWRRMWDALERARASLPLVGLDPAEHINASDFAGTGKMVEFGKGGPKAQDARLTRQGCYALAQEGDSRKPEIAAARLYFRVMTRKAELEIEARSHAPVARPLTDRLRETFGPHCEEMARTARHHFTVYSALAVQLLFWEEEVIRHLLPLGSTDSPDGSIGQCWANHRETKLKLPRSTFLVPLRLPAYDINVSVCAYEKTELSHFDDFLYEVYYPEKLPAYAYRKYQPRFGPLVSASLANNTCQRWTGRPAAGIRAAHRRSLEAAGGTIKVGDAVPALTGQRLVLGQMEMFS